MQVVNQASRFNVLECGRRFGKTSLGKNVLIETALTGTPSAWFAPTYKYQSEVWREVSAMVLPIVRNINQQERRIELITGGVIDFWSLDQPDAGRGRKYKRIVIDEAGVIRDLEAAWNESLRPTLVDMLGDAWFLGTPKGNGFFHRLFQRGQAGEADWRSWRLPSVTNPYINASEIEAARRDMPPEAFAQEFLGIPADNGGNPFGLTALAACEVSGLSPRDPVAFGVDLAKSVDYTVVCGLDDCGHPSVLERWQSDWQQTRQRIAKIVGNSPCLIDSTGVGDPIVEDLCRICPNMTGFKFTSTSKQQLMEGLAASVQEKRVAIPSGWLMNELQAFEFEYKGGRVSYSAPAGLHDDGVCALALAISQVTSNRINRVSLDAVQASVVW